MANTGAAPLNPTSDVGRIRLDLGDTEPTNVDVDAHTGDYAYFSDDAIGNALYLEGGSITRACGRLIAQLANQITIAGQSIKADDFAINTMGKGKDLFEVAKWYEVKADKEDARSSREVDGAYQVVNTSINKQRATFGMDLFC